MYVLLVLGSGGSGGFVWGVKLLKNVFILSFISLFKLNKLRSRGVIQAESPGVAVNGFNCISVS